MSSRRRVGKRPSPGITSIIRTCSSPTPPIPTKGDENNDSTYSAVGRVLTQWERVEVELAHLYACFKGQPTNSLNQIREYGSGTIFRERAQKLADAAHSYFRAKCCQHHEGDFDALMRRCLG